MRNFHRWLDKIYPVLFRFQNGTCAICRKPETQKAKGTVQRLSFDHNHETLEIRGLLCNRCNTALGMVKENVETLERMIAYIKVFNP